MLGECWLSDVEEEAGAEASQHEAGWGEILRVVCRLLAANSEGSSSVGSIAAGATPAPGVTDAFQVPFLLFILFTVTQPQSCFSDAGRAPAN